MDSLNLSRLIAQAECYKVLVSLFSEPKEGIHDNRKLYNSLIKSTGLLKPKALELAKKLRKTIADLRIEDLDSEYQKLFGDSETATANPNSGEYFSGRDGTTGSQAWISEFYENAGFSINHGVEDPGHIVTELKFIEFLLNNIAGSFSRDDSAMVHHFGDLRCRFVHEHMIRWIPEFTRSILYSSKSPFYLQLAILLRTLLITCSGEEDENSN